MNNNSSYNTTRIILFLTIDINKFNNKYKNKG